MAADTSTTRLLAQLADRDPRARLHAVLAALAFLDADRAFETLCRVAAEDPDPDVRQAASKAMGLLEDENPPLVPAGETGQDQLRDMLKQLLDDGRPRVRLQALSKVLRHRHRALLPEIESRLDVEVSPVVLAAMVSLLGQLGGPEHIGRLVPLLCHEDERVVIGAITALAALGGDAVQACLRPHLDSANPRVLSAACAALVRYDPALVFSALERLAAGDLRQRELAANALLQLDDPRGLQTIRNLATGPLEPSLAQALAAYLERPRDRIPDDVLAFLRDGLTSNDPSTRRRSLDEARSRLDEPEVRGLVEVLAGLDPDPEVAKTARDTLEARPVDLDGPESLPELAELGSALQQEAPAEKRTRLVDKLRELLGHTDERLRMKAVLKVKKHRVGDLLGVLLERLHQEDSSRVQAALLATIGDLGSEEEIPLVATFLSRRNHRVVNAAILALFHLGGDSVLPLFLQLLCRGEVQVRSQALVALLRLNGDELLAYVGAMATSAKDDVRSKALSCLDRIDSPQVEDLLVSMISRESSARLLKEEVGRLGSVVTARSVGPLWLMRSLQPEREIVVIELLRRISDRSGIALPELEAQGQELLRNPPDLPIFRELQAQHDRRTRASRRVPHLGPEPAPRRLAWDLAVGGSFLALVCSVVYVSLGTYRPQGRVEDPIARVQALVEERAAVRPPRPIHDLPAGASLVPRLQAMTRGTAPRIPVLKGAELVSRHRALLKAQGFDNDAYIDMEARGKVRAACDRAVAEARAEVQRRSFDAAIAILTAAIAATEPDNLLVLRDLRQELLEVNLKAGRLDESLAAALAVHEICVRIARILRETRVPGTDRTLVDQQTLAEIAAGEGEIKQTWLEIKQLGLAPGQDLGAVDLTRFEDTLFDLRSRHDQRAGRDPATAGERPGRARSAKE